MQKVIFPLQQNDTGSDVVNLQDALLLLLERAVIRPQSPLQLVGWQRGLRSEKETQIYGSTTFELVQRFQENKRTLRATGEVDKPTAAAINALLREFSALTEKIKTEGWAVSGTLKWEDGRPAQGVQIRADQQMERRFVQLGKDIADSDGVYTIRYTSLPSAQNITLRVTVLAQNGTALASKIISNAEPVAILDIIVPSESEEDKQRKITGTVFLEHGLPAENLSLRLYRREFGGRSTLLAETATLGSGQYAFTIAREMTKASLEVRAVHEGKEILLSKPLNYIDQDSPKPINLVAPKTIRPLQAEYRMLKAAVTPIVGDMKQLKDVQENDKQQDLTTLNRDTGWDARLLAVAALAARLEDDKEVKEAGLSHEFLYGLLRAGLPSDKLLLAQVSTDVAEKTMESLSKANIIEADESARKQFRTQFNAFRKQVRLQMPAPGSHSTYGELLKASELPDDDAEKFSEVFLEHRGGGEELWKKVRESGVKETKVKQLQRQGKLAFLAGNSAKMTAHLMKKDLADPVALVEQGLYKAEAWNTEIRNAAGAEEFLEDYIPAAYVAAEPDKPEAIQHRLDAYAEDMARKIRLSYPTHVIAHKLKTDAEGAFDTVVAANGTTAQVLKNAAERGFRLGRTPLHSFFSTHDSLLKSPDMPEKEYRNAVQQVEKLYRVYQLTSDDESMQVLLKHGITSSHDVYLMPEKIFVNNFGGLLGSYDKAVKIHRRARQIKSMTYNIAAGAASKEYGIALSAMTSSPSTEAGSKNELIKHYPTMEALFGSMDFCECEHCRSVLSPAAYLVDLLQFVENKYAESGTNKAYNELIRRRPDIPNIELTCENTNVALPYIDIVNEILEYYVAQEPHRLESDAAKNTDDAATTEELLAEPQNIIDAAYAKVQKARYPLNLPFDLWLETTREFCTYFETPLDQLLDIFRPSDDLFNAEQNVDRAAIFMEALGFSPSEIALFTDPDPLKSWWTLYGYANKDEATGVHVDSDTKQRTDLNSAKSLSRRLGITYKELVEIIKTGFINPVLHENELLKKIRIGINDLRFYLNDQNTSVYDQNKWIIVKDRNRMTSEERNMFDRIPSKELETTSRIHFIERRIWSASENLGSEFDKTKRKLEESNNSESFRMVLLLKDADAGCNFDETTIGYAGQSDGVSIADFDDGLTFIKINLFVRLWRKLGWTIEETDQALRTFIPANTPFEPAHFKKEPLKTALIYLSHLKVLDEKIRVGKQSRIKLLTLWSDMESKGKNSLYAQLFLRPSILKSVEFTDREGKKFSVFDDLEGKYLESATLENMAKRLNPEVKDFHLVRFHSLALQGALGVTADKIKLILEDAGKDVATEELSIKNVSLLYRYTLLAKGLKLSIQELIVLKALSGLNPFTELHPEPLADIQNDHPFSQTLRFVETAEAIKEGSLSIEDLEYLLLHQFDPVGKYRTDDAARTALLRTLSEGVRNILAEHVIPDDPASISEEVLKQKLGLVLPAEVVERFLSMMNGTVEFTVSVSTEKENDYEPLSRDTFAEESAIVAVSYDAVRKEQKLTFKGVLFDDKKTSLNKKFNSLQNGQHFIFSKLLDEIEQQAKSFFDNHLLKKNNIQPASGFLDATAFTLLFKTLDEKEGVQERQEHERKQKSKLVHAVIPVLRQRLIRQFIVETMVAQTGADQKLMETLLTDERLLGDPVVLLDAFAGTSKHGLDVKLTFTDDSTASALASTADTDWNGETRNLKKAVFKGFLEVPAKGAYRFDLQRSSNAPDAQLHFDHLPEPLFLHATTSDNNLELSNYLELEPGTPYGFSFTASNLNDATKHRYARLLVQSETLPKDTLSQLTLYPASTINRAERAFTRLSKVLLLLQSLELNEREARCLSTPLTDFAGLALSNPPVEETENRADGVPLFQQVLRLISYKQLKQDLAGGGDDLTQVFELAKAGKQDEVCTLLVDLTRREPETVQSAAQVLLLSLNSNHEAIEKRLKRLWKILQVVERFGIPATTMNGWTQIVNAEKEHFSIARNLKESVKARFEPEAWQRVAKPIFDRLRQKQRDALVAYVLHKEHFDRIEQLYEYFLIDPGMEPVVQTSRIRLAIASVQLFVQRCLLNLEEKHGAEEEHSILPSDIVNAEQWEWMKRYRVWEANRKIFLFPENWLEPEFRDDKSHLFTELEGTLLQGDVSSDLVEDALLTYLRKLDELARLDIVAMHCEYEEEDVIKSKATLHVFGRTFGEPHKYFYRRYNGGEWSPWEPVSAEIEGDHLAPVVWRNRLYLFWVTFMDKPDEDAKPGITSGSNIANASLESLTNDLKEISKKKKVEVQLHWSEYIKGEWSVRESSGYGGGDESKMIVSVPFLFNSNSVQISVTVPRGEDGGIYVNLHSSNDFGSRSFYLAGRNSTPEQQKTFLQQLNPYRSTTQYNYPTKFSENPTKFSESGALKVSFEETLRSDSSETNYPAEKVILERGNYYTLLQCNALTYLWKNSQVYSVKDSELYSLKNPFFYQDKAKEHTFFVEPTVTERTIAEWTDWLPPVFSPEVNFIFDPDLLRPPVHHELPKKPDLPGDPINWKINLFYVEDKFDILLNEKTVVEFESVYVCRDGKVNMPTIPTSEAGSILAEGGKTLPIAGAARRNRLAVLPAGSDLAVMGIVSKTDEIRIVGKAGIDAASINVAAKSKKLI